jgi:hypothetical protein
MFVTPVPNLVQYAPTDLVMDEPDSDTQQLAWTNTGTHHSIRIDREQTPNANDWTPEVSLAANSINYNMTYDLTGGSTMRFRIYYEYYGQFGPFVYITADGNP